MTDVKLIVIAFGHNTLALTADEFAQAIERARELLPAQAAPQAAQGEPWLDAEAMERATAVPASWWLDAARRGEIEHQRAGKYVRFRLSAAAEALTHRPESRPDQRFRDTLRVRNAR